jgi:hypothetical protein
MATNQPVLLQPRPNVRQINYLSKTFSEFRQNLIEFSKSYFPATYKDFNETSPGMMFIEMAAYLGDVLSFYIDNQFKENLLAYADQPENIITIAQFLGYKPKLIATATTDAELSVTVPAVLVGGQYVPNPLYLPVIGAGSLFGSSDSTVSTFKLMEDVNFKDITEENFSASDTTEGGEVLEFIVTKPAKLLAGNEKTATFGFTSAQKFSKITLPDDNILGIDRVVDSDGNRWYEVDFLAQDVVMDDVSVSSSDEEGVMPPAGLRLRKVPRRFVTRVTKKFKTELMFGAGEQNDAEVNVLVDSRQIATAQYGSTITNTVGNVGLNNLNFLNSYAYGLAPANTTLTVTYTVGGGVASNANANTINQINNLIVKNDTVGYTQSELGVFTVTINRITINNPNPATGGGPGDTVEEIRENALVYFNAQNRVVTADDYVIRTYSLPTKYGQIAKAYALRDEQLNSILRFSGNEFVQNEIKPTAVNLYTLGYNSNGKLSRLNTISKQNLARYLNQYRLLTDDINILDAFVINIGVNFSIKVFKNYNVQDVLVRCIGVIQKYFDITKWTINQPIIISELIYEIGAVAGVQTVDSVTIFNKYRFLNGLDYHEYRYDIEAATVDGVVYPSLDPSIFELRYPDTDIIGNATQ